MGLVINSARTFRFEGSSFKIVNGADNDKYKYYILVNQEGRWRSCCDCCFDAIGANTIKECKRALRAAAIINTL